MIRYAQVSVPVPLRSEFTYSFDSEAMDVKPGVRVIVPFNRRKLQGYVLSVTDEKPSVGFEIKGIQRVVDKEPLFDKKDYELAVWMAITSRAFTSGVAEAYKVYLTIKGEDASDVVTGASNTNWEGQQ